MYKKKSLVFFHTHGFITERENAMSQAQEMAAKGNFQKGGSQSIENEKLHLVLLLAGYWETLLHQLKAHIARARLREFHQTMLRKKLDELKKQVVSNE